MDDFESYIFENYIETSRFSEVRNLLEKGKIEEAYAILNSNAEGLLTPFQIVDFHFLLGLCLYDKGDIHGAIQQYSICLNLMNQKNVKYDPKEVYYELAQSLFSLYETTHEKHYLKRSFIYCKLSIDYVVKNTKHEDSPRLYVHALLLLGVLFQTQMQYDEAIEVFSISKSISQQYSDFKSLGIAYDELGNTYMILKEPYRAMYYFLKSIEAKKAINNIRGIQITERKIFMCSLLNPGLFKSEELEKVQECVRREKI